MVSNEIKPDMSCVPYRRKVLYFVLTIPFFAFLIAVFIYLWTISFLLAMVFLLFYLAMCYFQAYCCAYQECPYIGGFCPALVGVMPANILAKLIYGKKIDKSKKWFEIQAALASISWLGLIAFPVYWVQRLAPWFAVGYMVSHGVYYVIFGLTICPVCAIRETCPGGKLQSVVLKRSRC